MNLDITFVDCTNPKEFEKNIKKNTKLFFIEAVTNPLLKTIDINELSKIAKKNNILTVCDNTFMSPYNMNPILFGVDIVIHSVTKYLGGFSDLTLGII